MPCEYHPDAVRGRLPRPGGNDPLTDDRTLTPDQTAGLLTSTLVGTVP